MKYYLITERNRILRYATILTNRENIMQSEGNQSQEPTLTSLYSVFIADNRKSWQLIKLVVILSWKKLPLINVGFGGVIKMF